METDDLIRFEDGECDFYANGFDCRDCPFATVCDNYKDFD